MSSTITITRKEETTTESIYPVPSFYQEYDSTYVGILNEQMAVDFTLTDSFQSVSTGTPTSALKYKTGLKPITADEFYKAYNKCIQSITQKVAETVAA